MNQFGINEPALGIIKHIFSQYPEVEKVLLYGSRAKGTYHERSDVDLVICNSAVSRQLLGKIILDINNSNFPYTIDIQIFEKIKNKQLIEHIDRVGLLFYQKNML